MQSLFQQLLQRHVVCLQHQPGNYHNVSVEFEFAGNGVKSCWNWNPFITMVWLFNLCNINISRIDSQGKWYLFETFWRNLCTKVFGYQSRNWRLISLLLLFAIPIHRSFNIHFNFQCIPWGTEPTCANLSVTAIEEQLRKIQLNEKWSL